MTLWRQGWYGALGMKTVLKPHRAIRRYVLVRPSSDERQQCSLLFSVHHLTPLRLVANKLEVDGKEIKLPRKVRGILVLNMPSYAGGTQPWGTKKESRVRWRPAHAPIVARIRFFLMTPVFLWLQYKDPAINDGIIEVLGLKGALHLARIQTHTSAGKYVSCRTTMMPSACC